MAGNTRNFGKGAARGSRGRGRGKGAGFAQSGGKATTFAGTSGGGVYNSGAGGSRGQGVRGTGVNSSGTHYKVRNPSGDGTLVPGAAKNPPVVGNLGRPGGPRANPKKVARKGAARQAGGSTQ